MLDELKQYRQQRDELFAKLGECEHGSPAYDQTQGDIQALDAENEHLVDESCVHAESLNFGDIKRTFEHIPDQFSPQGIQDAIRGEFQQLLSSAAGQIAKEAFKRSAGMAQKTYNSLKAFRESKPDLVEAIDGLGISVTLSVITLHYDGFYGRAEGLTRLLNEQSQHFQFNRHSIRWIIQNTGPKSVDVNVSGELFTSAFSAGVGIHAPLALMVALVDEALAHAGVPE